MNEFNIGDWVRVADKKCLHFGATGEVTKVDNILGFAQVRLGGTGDFIWFVIGWLEHARRNDKSITRVIINKPAVIVFRNGKKCVAKAQDEPFDAERGLMVALLKSFGIGYSDLQKMLREAKMSKEYRDEQAEKAAKIVDNAINDWIGNTMIKRPIDDQKQYVNANSIDNDNDGFFSYAMKVLYGNRGKQSTRNKNATEIKIQKPKRGRPRKIVKDETPKPKRPVGRPRKSQLQYKVGDYVLVNGLFYQIKAFSEDKKKVFLYDARNQAITEHDVFEIMRVQK